MFYSSYWGGWASNAGWECGTASISMALSYVGINKTPKNILDVGTADYLPYWGGYGATHSMPSLSTAMSNYLNGNGKYSPPLIHFANGSYSKDGHYVLLIGKKSSNEYLVLDPYNDSIWTLSTSHSYYSAIDEVHQYYNSNAEIDPPIEGELVITSDKMAYQVGETVTITRNTVQNTNFYQLVIWYGGEQIISTPMNNSTYSFTVDTAGEYHIYLQVGNGTSGVVSTEKYVIYAENQIDTVPTVFADKNYYSVGEEIVFTRNTVPNTNYYQLKVCYVDEATGGEVQLLSVGMNKTTYTYSIDEPGKYYVYMSIGNSVSGVISSSADVFYVQEPVTEAPKIWVDFEDGAILDYERTICIYRDNVPNATDYSLVLNGEIYHGVDVTEQSYAELTKLNPGSYTAYMIASNEVTGEPIASNVINFTVKEPHTCFFRGSIIKQPTCEEDGLALYQCTCGEMYNEVVPAFGHDIVPATCTVSEYCQWCFVVLGEPLGHSYSHSVVKKPTCEEDGIRLYYCDCGEEYNEVIPALGHSYSATITKAPTCNTYGVKTFTCIHCSDSYAEPIAKTNHVYSDEFTVDTEPTYFSAGMKSRHCLTCTAKTDYTPIDPLVPSATMMVTVRKAMLNNSTSKEYDFNGDGAVNILDLIKLKKSYAGVY